MTERPLFPPPSDGARDVLRRARALRRRRALATTGGVAVAAAVTGLVLGVPGAGAGADRLRVVPGTSDRTPQHSTPADPGRALPVPSPTAGLRAGAGQPAASTGAASGSNGRQRGAGTTPVSSPTPYAPTKRHSASAPIHRTTVGFNSGCDATNDVAGWCVIYSGPHQAARKRSVTLSMELCRPAVNGDGQVQFRDTRQVGFTLSDWQGNLVWQAGQGVRNKSATTTTTVRAGTCLRWSAVWDTITRSGFYAPPANYGVDMSVNTSDITTTFNSDTLTLHD